jgi:hypothetical protein
MVEIATSKPIAAKTIVIISIIKLVILSLSSLV